MPFYVDTNSITGIKLDSVDPVSTKSAATIASFTR